MLWLTGLCNILLPTLSLVILNTIVVRTIEKHAQVVMIKWWWYWWWCLRKDTKDVKDVDHHKTFITAFTASWHDGQEYGTKRDNTTSKRGSWIILFGPPPHKMFAPVSVYTLFISYIFFYKSREQEFSCLQTNDKIFAKKKSLFALEWVLFCKIRHCSYFHENHYQI